jgi:hypothetical protein
MLVQSAIHTMIVLLAVEIHRAFRLECNQAERSFDSASILRSTASLSSAVFLQPSVDQIPQHQRR